MDPERSRELDALLVELLREPAGSRQSWERPERPGPARPGQPEIEVLEEPESLRVRALLPGNSRWMVRWNVERGRLELWAEGDRQAYFRQIPLPQAVDAERASSRLRQGCLELSLPWARRRRAA
jgi:HSP20 family molecular chaperone IbpA